MSGQNKRILPPTASTTAALIPISQSAYAASLDRSRPNDALIDQLVGGLIQSQQPLSNDSERVNQSTDFGASTRTYSIDDEEIDEPPVPIPSTWRQQQPVAEPNWYLEQLRASAYGFAIGLFVVIPAVMLLTGQTERIPSWQSVISYAKATGSQLGLDTIAASTAPPVTRETPPASAPAPTTVAALPSATTEPEPLLQPEAQPVAAKPVAASIAPKLASPRLEPKPIEPRALHATAPPAKSATIAVVQVQPVTIAKPLADEGASAANAKSALTSGETRVAAIDPNAPLAPQPAPLSSNPAVESAPAIAAPSARPPAEPPQQRPAAVAAVQPGARPSPVTAPVKVPISIAMAHEKIKGGEMDEARIMLARLASQGDSNAVFALAETFDPNVLAAWGTHGEEANSEKARMFYSMALSQGVSRAELRLKALQP